MHIAPYLNVILLFLATCGKQKPCKDPIPKTVGTFHLINPYLVILDVILRNSS